jgi:photosystem II stability/assembly factor-like uncharacterized protein
MQTTPSLRIGIARPRAVRRFIASLLLSLTILSTWGALPAAAAAFLGWSVGQGGRIVHTVDGGASWTPQVSGTTSTLLDVDFVDPLNGWAVGRGGVILHTVNGGTNWLPQVSGTTVSLSGVAFSDALIGTAVGNGGVTFYTQDGGAIWHGPGFPNATTRNDLFGIDAPPGSFKRIEVGAAGTPLVSPDGGITFFTPFSITTNTLFDVSLPDPNNGMVVGNNSFTARTPDGGFTYFPPVKATAAGNDLFGVDFRSSRAVVVGAGGVTVRSVDNGLTWFNPVFPTTNDLFDVSFIDTLNGIAVGAGGVTIRTSDGGVTWFTPVFPTTDDLNGVSVVVPEPSSLVIFGIGFGSALWSRRRQ